MATQDKVRINESIRASEVRAIGPDGENFGVISTKEAIAKVGENIKVSSYKKISAGDGEYIGSYIHLGGKVGVLIKAKLYGRTTRLATLAALPPICSKKTCCCPG